MLEYSWLWIKPGCKKKISANKMFDLGDFAALSKISTRLGRLDPAWFPRLFEPTTKGIRTWEYGLLLSDTTFRKKTVLDAGSGNSRLPLFLSRLGARVMMLDMDEPLEKTEIKRERNLRFVLGDMTKLKFADNSFDRVICISAIEHVDMKGEGKFYEDKEYIKRALQSIKELARVTKVGGTFYLTTDFYLPEQKTDEWPGSTDKIHGGFAWKNLSIFANEIQKNGIKLLNSPEMSEKILRDSKRRANYRGRYFTTFAFKGIKS
jgi:ubiquinone/menaquinone biosynthesis C-methylase UbiE